MNKSITIGNTTFKNPLTVASGTFGVGRDFVDFVDLNKLGAITSKGIASTKWQGNKTPRVAETYAGMLNAIGLQNEGVDSFIANEIPFLNNYNTGKIINIVGKTVEEYQEVAEKLSEQNIDAIEVNISCPNIKEGGVAFGTNALKASEVTKAVKQYSKDKLVIVKLSPNVTDITEIAKAVESAGADAISLINTLIGMRIDIVKGKPILANKIGGLSGPCIKPVAIRMVYQCFEAIKIPIIGMGGVSTWQDVVEFMLAGASMVAVGTANFSNPNITMNILEGFENYLVEKNIENVTDLIGRAH